MGAKRDEQQGTAEQPQDQDAPQDCTLAEPLEDMGQSGKEADLTAIIRNIHALDRRLRKAGL